MTDAVKLAAIILVALSTACGLADPASVASQPLLDGVWEGRVEMPGMKKRFLLRFGSEQGRLRATLDVPTSFTEGFPLRDLTVNAGSIRIQRWDTDQQGYYKGGADLYLTARDMARFGFLYL